MPSIEIHDLKSMEEPLAGRRTTGIDTVRLLSVAAMKRLFRFAGGVRFGATLLQDPGNDKFGVVHSIFRDNIDEISQKAIFVMIGQKKRTLLPRHIAMVGTIMGEHGDMKDLPHIPRAPIKRRIHYMNSRSIRLNDVAVRMITSLAIDRTVRALRSGVGLAAHENGRITVRDRDVRNAHTICRDYPNY